jgi:hypothetical protein
VTSDANEPDRVTNVVEGDVSGVLAGEIHGDVHYHQPRAADDDPEILDHVPATEDEIGYVIRKRPWSWEYLLYAGELQVGLRDRQQRPRVPSTSSISFSAKDAAIGHVTTLLDELGSIATKLNGCLNAEVLSRALGDPPARRGDWRLISDTARRLLAVYDEMQDWSASVSEAKVPRSTRRLYEVTSQVADQPLRDIRRFARELVAELNTLLDNASQGLEQSHVPTLACQLSTDDSVMAELTKELKRAHARFW